MVRSTLRENRRGATHQLATTVNQARMRVLVQQAFYQHECLGPGAPLTQITGQGEGNGYYDWAGRRLFFIDGEPDPMCPGAYRYQHNPSCCDLEAPDSDPRSPRYEPMHLRHRPGDTWIIDTNRPYDPFDPGPFGTPGWYQDKRTGRHRRDETPDPLPAEGWTPPQDAWFPGTADWPEPAAPQEKTHEPAEWSDRRGGSDRPPPTGSGRRPVPSDPDEPPRQRRRERFWDGDDHTADRADDRGTGEHRFSKLREDAFDRFMIESAQLRAAHFQVERPYLRERAAWVLRWLLWVLACGLVPMPFPLTARERWPEPAAPQPIPTQVDRATRAQDGARQVFATPGAALAATVDGARAARAVIAARGTSVDLAAAVRDSAAHWRAHPRQDRPRPSPRPVTGSYMTAWEQAFDAGSTFVLSTGGAA